MSSETETAPVTEALLQLSSLYRLLDKRQENGLVARMKVQHKHACAHTNANAHTHKPMHVLKTVSFVNKHIKHILVNNNNIHNLEDPQKSIDLINIK